MRQPSLIMKIVTAVLLVGVLVYFGIYLVRSYQGGVSTVLAYEDTINLGLEATGVLVREETVLSSSAAANRLVDLVPSEGEKVAAGGVIATLYSSSSGLEAKQQITALETEIEQLQYVLNSSGSAGDAAKLDAEVLDAIAQLRSSAALGDLSDLEDDTLALRTLVFKRDYTYGDTTAADAVAALIQEKTSELLRLRATLGTTSTTLYAPQSGIFSSLVDGFEEVLNPSILDWVTPSQLTALQNRQTVVDASAMGRLITSATWYFAASVPEEDAADLVEGKKYSILFSRDWSGETRMTLERISEPEQGLVVLVFSCRTHLSDITLLRGQTVEVVTSTLTGIRVPRQALRAITETVTNEETGKEEQVTTLGVYVIVGAKAEFKQVSVLWQDDDTYLVEPLADPNITNNDRADAKRLQAGDEIILSTAGIYNGKVVR